MTGAAIIRDRKGNTYVAEWAESGDRSVTFKGRLRHHDLAGTRLYPPRLRTLPLDGVSIEWLVAGERVAA